jgi:hypothetical protein
LEERGNEVIEMEVPKEFIIARFKNAVKRSRKYKIDVPIENDYLEIVKESDGKCYYCDVEMIASGKPIEKVFSVDHLIPLCYTYATRNTKDNLCVCCTRCNIVKGTVCAFNFKKLIQLLKINPHFFDDYMKEAFVGKMAEKIVRVKEESTMFPMVGEEVVRFM